MFDPDVVTQIAAAITAASVAGMAIVEIVKAVYRKTNKDLPPEVSRVVAFVGAVATVGPGLWAQYRDQPVALLVGVAAAWFGPGVLHDLLNKAKGADSV